MDSETEGDDDLRDGADGVVDRGRGIRVGRVVPTARQTRTPRARQTAADGRRRWTSFLSRFGPGLITGASDDDPSGIATYSQAGSHFGTGLLWTLLFSYPLMGGIQEISARIGRVTGRGLAGNLRRHFPRPVLYAVVCTLLTANVINIAADIGAMSASFRMLFGGPPVASIVAFGAGTAVLQVFVPYHRYVAVLKWLCVALFGTSASRSSCTSHGDRSRARRSSRRCDGRPRC